MDPEISAKENENMKQAKIDTRLLIGVTVISVLVLIAVWRLAGLPPV